MIPGRSSTTLERVFVCQFFYTNYVCEIRKLLDPTVSFLSQFDPAFFSKLSREARQKGEATKNDKRKQKMMIVAGAKK